MLMTIEAVRAIADERFHRETRRSYHPPVRAERVRTVR
jgi:hypothetical protein